MICASYLFASQAQRADHESGLRADGVAHVAKDAVKPFLAVPRAGADDLHATVGAAAPYPAGALVSAGVALIGAAALRRRLRFSTLASRAPPGGYAFS